jgi:TonB family protein
MFSLNAFTPEGKPLELSNTGIYVQVPVKELKDGMMLYQGVKDENGKVDWVNPTPMEKLPIAKSMAEIDLYPPKYEPKLNELKWFTGKAQRDSLYQSFEEEFVKELDSTLRGVPAWGLLNSAEPKGENPMLPNNNFSVVTSVSMLGLSKTNDWLKGTDYYSLSTATEASQIGIELPQDKVHLDFSVQKIKGTNEAWVICNVSIIKDWKINSIYKPVNSFGIPTELLLMESSDYEIIGKPIEPHPIIEFDQAIDENLSYHSGNITFKQKIRIKNQNASVSGKFSYQACKMTSHCLPPYEAYFILPMNGRSATPKSHIPPSKVLAIWNTKFDNTNLATVDFEKRMKIIHNTCDERVFDIYAKNLNTPLWQLDQQVVKLGYPEFQQFADERVGKLKLTDAHQQNLRVFYDEAIKTIRKKGKEAAFAAIKKDRDWDQSLSNERTQEVYRKGLRESVNRQEEFQLNFDNVCKQLGYTKSFYLKRNNKVKRKAFSKPAPNIVNIDRLVREATANRQSTIFQDAKTGKTAKLTYSAFSLEVENAGSYDKLYVYLFPKEINSYQRLDLTNGKLNYKLNGDMNYKAVVVGMNEKGFFLNELGELKPVDLGKLPLNEVSESEFDKRINAMNSGRTTKTMEIQSELNWLFKEKANYKVQKQRRENAAFRALVRPTIYRCEDGMELIPEPADIQVMKSDWPEEEAKYPGGKEAMDQFLVNNLDYPKSALDEGISGTVYLKFKVLESGKIENVEIKKGIPDCEDCNLEAKRMVEKMPNWIPAKSNGKNVSSNFTLPILFSAR